MTRDQMLDQLIARTKVLAPTVNIVRIERWADDNEAFAFDRSTMLQWTDEQIREDLRIYNEALAEMGQA